MKAIPLSKYGKNKGKFVALVDDADFEWLNKYNWFITGRRKNQIGYAARYEKGRKVILMAREILDAPEGMDVDHKDLNSLNNQRHNIRVCTTSQNLHNVAIRKTNKSGYRGVSFMKSKSCRKNPWMATISINGERILLGYYPNPEEAAAAYNKIAQERYGSFARLNTIKEVA